MRKIITRFVPYVFVLLLGVLLNDPMSSAAEVRVTERNFPDDVFRNYVSREVDKDKNGVLSDAEIIQTTKIVIKGDKRDEDYIVKNYQGISCFAELEELAVEAVVRGEAEDDCGDYIDISLDVSGNQKLKRFSCISSRVQNLDLSACPLLEEITLRTGERPVQDLSKNTNIKKLIIDSHDVDIILPQKLPLLETLKWSITKDIHFPAIDLRASKNLSELSLFGFDFSNQELNLKEFVHLRSFAFGPWKKDGIVSVNLEGCSALEKANIQGVNKINLQGCSGLKELEVSGLMPELDVRNLLNLERLTCIGLTGRTLDLRNNYSLKFVGITTCYYTDIFLSEQAAYQEVTVDENNNLAKLDVRNIQVKDLNCNRNQNLKQLLLSKGKKYDTISARYNQLTSMDLRGVWVDDINCDNNKIKKLLLSKSGKYKAVSVKNNRLTKLDLRKVKVKVLDCKNNRLRSLKVRGNKVLKELYCQNNQLKVLDVRKCKRLKILQYAGNKKLKKNGKARIKNNA